MHKSKRIPLGVPMGTGMCLAAFLVFSACYGTAVAGDIAPDKTAMQECLLKAVETAPGGTTVDELRAKCQAEQTATVEKETNKSIVDGRLYIDEENVLRPFTLMAHRPNYILPVNYNGNPNNEPWREAEGDPNLELDNVEAQFQVSIKVPLAVDLLENKMDIYAAYTVRSYWQVYNSVYSAPFRETNHEPEAWLQFRNNWSFWGIKNSVNVFGFNHQSNGRNEPISRSWNRIFANFIFEKGNLVFGIKPWYRLQEDDDEDNNPDITDFMGHFQILGAYKWGGQYIFHHVAQ